MIPIFGDGAKVIDVAQGVVSYATTKSLPVATAVYRKILGVFDTVSLPVPDAVYKAFGYSDETIAKYGGDALNHPTLI